MTRWSHWKQSNDAISRCNENLQFAFQAEVSQTNEKPYEAGNIGDEGFHNRMITTANLDGPKRHIGKPGNTTNIFKAHGNEKEKYRRLTANIFDQKYKLTLQRCDQSDTDEKERLKSF